MGHPCSARAPCSSPSYSAHVTFLSVCTAETVTSRGRATQAMGAQCRGRVTAVHGTDGPPALPSTLPPLLTHPPPPQPPWGPQNCPGGPRAAGFIERASRDNHPFPSCVFLGLQKPSVHNRKPIALCYQKTFPSHAKCLSNNFEPASPISAGRRHISPSLRVHGPPPGGQRGGLGLGRWASLPRARPGPAA